MGLRASGDDVWIDMQRGMGFEHLLPDGSTTGAATEAPIRSQFHAWLDYMTAGDQP